MSVLALTLGDHSVRNALIESIQENFVFVVGEQRYSCPRILSHLLSRTISVHHTIDASISEYTVETKDTHDQFPIFQLFGIGGTVQVTLENPPFLFSFLGCRLASDEPICSLLDDDAIPFIACEFYKLDDSQLDQIPVFVLYHIFFHPSLTISSESALYSYIWSRHSANPEYCTLFQFLQFEYLPAGSICAFVLLNPESIHLCLWATISARLSSPLLQSPTKVEFPLKEDKLFDGIISFLVQKHGGNVHDKGIVKITSKSVHQNDPQWAVRNIGGLMAVFAFWSKDDPVRGFAGISTKCASTRLITQSKVPLPR
jgi:hypothetical protein